MNFIDNYNFIIENRMLNNGANIIIYEIMNESIIVMKRLNCERSKTKQQKKKMKTA